VNKWILVLLAVLVLLGLMRAYAGRLAFLLLTPIQSFDALDQPPEPDYQDMRFWAFHPKKSPTEDKEVDSAQPDVFFLQPTSFRSPFAWNETIGNAKSEARMLWIIDHLVSTFYDCCQIFAPYYRQATLASYWQKALGGYQARNLAYSDTLKAFDNYIENSATNQPFILAGHSQGSEHGMRLLRDRIYGTALMERLIAAYLIGIPMSLADIATDLPHLQIYQQPDDTGCLINFSAFREGTDPTEFLSNSDWFERESYRPSHFADFVCVNPLTWQTNNLAASADLHLGALLDNGAKPKTSAVCRDSVVFVEDLSKYLAWDLNGNYHVYDYGIFYENIKANLQERITAHQSLHQ